MLIQQLALDAAFATLRSVPTGLSEADAAARRLEFGPNRIERLARTSLTVRVVRQFTHFFAVLLWVAALLALIADRWMPGQGMLTLAAAIVAVIAINGAFSLWQEYRAEETMAALQRLLPHQVRALRNGTTVVLPSEDVVPGDVIFLTAGDDVPADCRLVEGFGVRVNNATVTGEARPVSRDARPSVDTDLLQSRNVLLAGTSVTSGEAKALVFATGMHTAFGRIAHLTQTTADPPSPLQNEIASLSRVIAALAVTIGLVVFVIGRFIGLSTSVSLVFAIGIIVANVPEGLLPTVTLAMALAARRMGKRQHAGAPPAQRRDAWLRIGDLHRQDRHADAEPHGDSVGLRGRRVHRSACRGDGVVRRQPPPPARMRRVLPRPERRRPTRSPPVARRSHGTGADTDGVDGARRRAGVRTHRRDPLRTGAQAAGDAAPRGWRARGVREGRAGRGAVACGLDRRRRRQGGAERRAARARSARRRPTWPIVGFGSLPLRIECSRPTTGWPMSSKSWS